MSCHKKFNKKNGRVFFKLYTGGCNYEDFMLREDFVTLHRDYEVFLENLFPTDLHTKLVWQNYCFIQDLILI